MQFKVSFDDKIRTVRLAFGSKSDLCGIRSWKAPRGQGSNPHIRDSIEYSRLASKRWHYYRRENSIAESLRTLRLALRRNPETETAFCLIARATWFSPSPILGLIYCRRTWCHHIIVDFAACHPSVLGEARLRGVGTGMFLGLIRLALMLKVGTVWGEATKNSATFYEKALGLSSVKDHFFIRGETMDSCLRQYAGTHPTSKTHALAFHPNVGNKAEA